MLTKQVVFVVVFHLSAVAFCSKMPTYNVPKPRIEVFYPRGFRVSIPDEPGMMEFGFHGNVNRPIHDLENGEHSGKVLKPRNGEWTYENRDAELQEHDLIHYWLFVIKDNLGYIEDGGKFYVGGTFITTTENLPVQPSFTSIDTAPIPSKLPVQPYTPPATTESQLIYNNNKKHATHKPDSEFQTSLDLANSIYNTVENLTVEIKRLREINAILVELVEQDSIMSKTLTLKGMLPPYDDPVYVVHVVLKEKLGLSIPVVAARKNSDGSISFEVASVNDKIQVIKIAKKNLSTSKIHLVY